MGGAAWIVADWATRRLNPQVASAVDLVMRDLQMRVEVNAFDHGGSTEAAQAAEIGAQRAVDLAEDAKQLT
ncbi:hypothetical protein [Streptomyces qinglanensis]|uniref:hypothetical protein n=1 Tax=Streptomyces qinglanensis TaxID=943816 RepID=UPI003793F223